MQNTKWERWLRWLSLAATVIGAAAAVFLASPERAHGGNGTGDDAISLQPSVSVGGKCNYWP